MSDNCECKFKPTERIGLYFMVFWIFLNCRSCDTFSKLQKVEVKIDSIEQKLDEIQARNVQAIVKGLSTNNITHKNTIPLEKN
jgi:hypothetical protein